VPKRQSLPRRLLAANLRSLQRRAPAADRRGWRIAMPELRQNFFTKEWGIIATERSKRPEGAGATAG